MEQQLIDALEKACTSGDIDDVSKDMISARVMNALIQVRELTNQYLKNLEAIQKEHTIELKLGGLSVVLNVTDDLAKNKQACILGSKDKVLKNIVQIMEIANGK